VAADHELSLDAIVLIKAGSVPKTSSGKIQRHACRDGYVSGTLKVVGQWPFVEKQAATAAGSSSSPGKKALGSVSLHTKPNNRSDNGHEGVGHEGVGHEGTTERRGHGKNRADERPTACQFDAPLADRT